MSTDTLFDAGAPDPRVVPDDVTLSARVPAELRGVYVAEARRRGMTLSDVVREALGSYARVVETFPTPRHAAPATTEEAARDRAITRAGQGADPRWLQAAADAVEHAARHRDHLTTDDVWDLLDTQEYETPEPRAMGAVMRRAKANGLVEPTERMTPGRRAGSHRRPVRQWRSLIGPSSKVDG